MGNAFFRRMCQTPILCTALILSLHSASFGETVRVFLLAGQSNMFGKGEAGELSPPWSSPQNDVWIWQDNLRDTKGWTALRPGFGNTDSNLGSAGDNLRNGNPNAPFRFGPELSIGRTLADAFPNDRIALVKHSTGGTDVYSDWNPVWDPAVDGPYNLGDMYGGLSAKFADATNQLNRLGLDYEVSAIFWAQGGRDALVLDKALAYEHNLRRTIAAMREDYGDPQLPFILARLDASNEHWPIVRAAHEAIAASDPFTLMIDTDDISDTSATDTHWNTIGQLQAGARFADAYIDFVAVPEPSTVWLSAVGLALVSATLWHRRAVSQDMKESN